MTTRPYLKAHPTVYSVFTGDNSAGIATRYGLDGPGIESRWVTRFSSPAQTGPGHLPDSYTIDTGSLSWGSGSRDMALATHPQVKERVELYFYFSAGPLLPVLG
jgi:hypothetical protein